MKFRVRIARWKRIFSRRKVVDDLALLFRFASMNWDWSDPDIRRYRWSREEFYRIYRRIVDRKSS